MQTADWAPVINPIANLVFSSRGGAHTVIVDGKVVMSAGTVRTLDEEHVLREGQEIADQLAERSGVIRFASHGGQWSELSNPRRDGAIIVSGMSFHVRPAATIGS